MTGRLPSVVGTGGDWRLATSSCLAVGPWVADAVVVISRYDGDNSMVWACLVTQETNGLLWLPGTTSLVVGALCAVRSVAAHDLMAIDIANDGAVGRSACEVAAGVF